MDATSIDRSHAAWPAGLGDLRGSFPRELRVRGTWPAAGPGVAIVGSRCASADGIALARTWARQLAERGHVIWSGGAMATRVEICACSSGVSVLRMVRRCCSALLAAAASSVLVAGAPTGASSFEGAGGLASAAGVVAGVEGSGELAAAGAGEAGAVAYVAATCVLPVVDLVGVVDGGAGAGDGVAAAVVGAAGDAGFASAEPSRWHRSRNSR